MNKQKRINDALEDVDQAFKQLEFAMKLWWYCGDNHLDQEKFDSDNTVMFKSGSKVFPNNSFGSYAEIVKCSAVNVGICFGASAIALDSAFKEAGFTRKEKAADDIMTVVYMVRCAFAHNIAEPKWKVEKDFLRQVNLPFGIKSFTIDFKQLNGYPFKYEDIGELPGWYNIKDESIKMIKNPPKVLRTLREG